MPVNMALHGARIKTALKLRLCDNHDCLSRYSVVMMEHDVWYLQVYWEQIKGESLKCSQLTTGKLQYVNILVLGFRNALTAVMLQATILYHL